MEVEVRKSTCARKPERVLISSVGLHKLVNHGLRCSRLDISGNHPKMDVKQFIKVEQVVISDLFQEIYSAIEESKSRITVNGTVVSSS